MNFPIRENSTCLHIALCIEIMLHIYTYTLKRKGEGDSKHKRHEILTMAVIPVSCEAPGNPENL